MESVRHNILARLHFYRREDTHECDLINARVSWMMYMQTLLITSYFIIATNSSQVFVFYNSVLLFSIAIYFALSFGKTVRAAELMVFSWHLKEKNLYKEILKLEDGAVKEELISYFVTHKYAADDEEDKRNSDAFSFHKVVTPIVVMFWVMLFGFSTWTFIKYEMTDASKTPTHVVEPLMKQHSLFR